MPDHSTLPLGGSSLTEWDPHEKAPLITQEDAKKALDAGSALFVDVRRPDQFNRLRLPGAVLVPIRGEADHLFRLPRDLDVIIY
jgi:rhodanese-related sulfurtransferase